MNGLNAIYDIRLKCAIMKYIIFYDFDKHSNTT